MRRAATFQSRCRNPLGRAPPSTEVGGEERETGGPVDAGTRIFGGGDVEDAGEAAVVLRGEGAAQEVGVADGVIDEGAEEATDVEWVVEGDAVETDEVLVGFAASDVVANVVVVTGDDAWEEFDGVEEIDFADGWGGGHCGGRQDVGADAGRLGREPEGVIARGATVRTGSVSDGFVSDGSGIRWRGRMGMRPLGCCAGRVVAKTLSTAAGIHHSALIDSKDRARAWMKETNVVRTACTVGHWMSFIIDGLLHP